jgi:energy-converting hydrogenase Eha subunit C
VPGLATAHAVAANEPEECYQLLETAAFSITFVLYYDIPAYWAKLMASSADDARDAYRHFRDQVAIMQSRVAGRRWLSKSPAHLLFLDTLLETFPDAAIVIPHREPLEAIPSLCSLIALARSAASDDIDSAHVGATALDWFLASSRRAEAARATLTAPRILDVTYANLLADPIGTVRAIYDRFGYPFTAEFERRMRDWLARNPQHKHGVHRYSLAQFGLDPARVRAVTEDYRRKYLSG